MALLNDMYIHVTDEQVDTELEISEHSVENGPNISDNIRVKPAVLSLEGKIVDYEAYSSDSQNEETNAIRAWISLVKKDGSAFESMSFSRLNDELLHFTGGCRFVNTGQIQYITAGDRPVDLKSGAGITQIKFEVYMPSGSTARIQNAYKEWCCFNIINKSSTGYEIQDYNADAEVSSLVYSNTYNGERGRVRTEFTNYDIVNAQSVPDIHRKASWVLEQLRALQRVGALVKYEGRNYLENYQIKSLSTTHGKNIAGGADFSATLQQCRLAANSYWYGDNSNGGLQQISQGDNAEVWYEVQVGDSIQALISGDYAGLSRPAFDGNDYSALEWVLKRNAHAFDDPEDVTTLKAYEKILLGVR